MGDEEQATLDGQFYEFSRLLDNKKNSMTITLYCSDYWMRQANILNDRNITMTDTGLIFNKYSKTELYYDEWLTFLSELCEQKNLNEEKTKEALTNCGLPGQSQVTVPAYREFFLTYKPKAKMVLIIATQRSTHSYAGHRHRLAELPPRTALKRVSATPLLKFETAQRTRYLEIAGFSISLIALLISLLIFTHFKSLRNNRTNIHRNLFFAMTIQVIIRLIVYIDQAFLRDKTNKVKGINNMPYVCEISYILLEYAISSMFMWMFIEGLFLHIVVTANALRERTSHVLYMAIGWGLPALVTAIWAIVTGIHYNKDEIKKCWYGYNFLSEYWFLQAPRLAVILINLIFLLHIMRVLITKLNATENNEMTKVKKAARAALVLLPLLGITNILNMVEPPLDGSVWKFAFWCYLTHFLRSFQGFFIAFIYCFMNGEVNEVVRKSYRDWENERQDMRSRRTRSVAAHNARISWCQQCLFLCFVAPFRWIRKFFQINNTVRDAGIVMGTSEEIRIRNYADPEFQSCMEEIRVENDTLVIGSV